MAILAYQVLPVLINEFILGMQINYQKMGHVEILCVFYSAREVVCCGKI